jgi:alpha 1,2-mannosyltransferase
MSQLYNKSKTVIVYLAMNTSKDESYGRDSRSMLEKSLDSLYEYYNNEFKHDIIVFYDNKFPFLEKDQIEISKGRNEIKFQLLDGELWKPPDCDEIRNNPNPSNWVDPKFSVGYRNMMRWYGILIYKFLTNLGYEWYMRMDDDSLLHSKIEYDLFKYLYDNNYEYGFRTYVNDHISVSNGLIEFCKKYIDQNNIKPTFIDRFIKDKSMWDTHNYNIVGYYNNFLISKLSFWMRDDVQHFLNEFDNSGYQYTKRWNDLISQAVTIQIFMERNKIYQFNDFTYEHTTFGGNYDSKSTIAWGGIFPKVLNLSLDKSSYVQNWYNKYNVMSIFCLQTFNIKDIIKTENNCNLLQIETENNCNFRPNNNDDIFYLGNYNDIEDIYLAINDHYLLCTNFDCYCKQFTYPEPVAFVWKNNNLYVINNSNIITKKSDINTISFIPSQSLLINPHLYY